MTTLRSISTTAGRPLSFLIGLHHSGPCHTAVTLLVDGRGARATATLCAHHVDPEGSFTEQLDAGDVLDRVGEFDLAAALARLSFDSGTPTDIYSPEDFAAVAPEILDR